MESKLLTEDGSRTYVLVFGHGDGVMEGLQQFATSHDLSSAHFTAIGALSDAELAYFDWERKDYRRIPVDEQVEVLALTGDVATKEGSPALHAHVVLGRSDGTAVGGHLVEAHVRPTLEVMLTETPAHLRKRIDEETGLALIDPHAEDGA
jgi:uncharacterized protein